MCKVYVNMVKALIDVLQCDIFGVGVEKESFFILILVFYVKVFLTSRMYLCDNLLFRSDNVISNGCDVVTEVEPKGSTVDPQQFKGTVE